MPLNPPFGPANRLVSPNGAYALSGDAENARLWLEDLHSQERRMVFRVTVQTLTMAWAPDSGAFLANDREFSDLEVAYVYDVKTLDRLDLRARIVAADAGSARFFVPGQIAPARPAGPGEKVPAISYVHGIGWTDPRHVEVQLVGHTGGARRGTSLLPGDCFDLRYWIGRDGAVQKLSQRVFPIDDKTGCGEK